MSDEPEVKQGQTKKVSQTVSRDMLRQVIGKRKELKKELRRLKERLKELPQDWPERLPAWLDLEAKAAQEEGRSAGEEMIEAKELEAERAGWQDRERNYQQQIAELTLAQRIRAAALAAGAYDPGDVVALTRNLFLVSFDDGQPQVGLSPEVEGMGLKRLNPEGAEYTLEEVIARFLENKPHLVRAKAWPGSGARPNLIKTTLTAPPDPAQQSGHVRWH